MSVTSIRFTKPTVAEQLKQHARAENVSISALAERLIDEGLRQANHPSVVFRDGPAGRRAALTTGPEVIDVIGYLVGSDVPPEERRSRAALNLCIPVAAVDAALAYYADYTTEIDEALAERQGLADAEELSFRRQRELLTR